MNKKHLINIKIIKREVKYMSIIYLAKPKDFINKDQHKEKKYNYLVLKEHKNKFKKLLRNHKPVRVDLFTNYDPSDKYLLSFKIEEFHSAVFKAHVDSKFKEFTKGTYNINKESISEFFKFLEADGLYDFEACSPSEELIESSAPMNFLETPHKEVITSSHNLLEERDFSSRSRSNSLSEEKTDTESVRKANSLSKLSVENSSITSLASSTSSLESLENDPQKCNSDQFFQAEKICSFFTNKSNLYSVAYIKNHGEKIKNGYFNGKEKSEILLSIYNTAKKIKDAGLDLRQDITAEGLAEIKEDIKTLNACINDQTNLKILSRYRGFSPLKCFATLWGGGKVTSMEYIDQLRNELSPFIDEAFSNRPTV